MVPLRPLLTTSGLTLVSRILGLVRDLVVASVFGAGMATDAFFVAFRIPNLLRRFSAEGAFSQAFVPVFNEYRLKRSTQETRVLVSVVATAMALILAVLCVFVFLAAPWVIKVMAPGLQHEACHLASTLLRLVFPYVFFISLASLAQGVLNSHGHFFAPAASPIVLNLCLIAAALLSHTWFDVPILALGWAVLLAGMLQLFLQLPFLVQKGFLPCFTFKRHEGLSRIGKNMLPVLFGASVAQIALLINTIIASFLPEGSISWLYYADRIMELPVGLLGAALATVLLPKFCEHFENGHAARFSALLLWGLKMTAVFLVPATFGLALLAKPIATALFMHGAYSSGDALQTAKALLTYSFGLLPLVAVKVLASVFYAQKDTKTPARTAFHAILIAQASNIVFVPLLQHAGLALSLALSAWLQTIFLGRSLHKNGILILTREIIPFLLQVIVSAFIMSCFIFVFLPQPTFWLSSDPLRFVVLAISVAGGACIYAAMLWLLRFDFRSCLRLSA